MVTDRNLADMPGMDITIRETVRSYRQGPLVPASAVLPDMRVSLPIPLWAEAGFHDNGSANYTAGQTVSLTILQIPATERALILGVQAFRDSGDNTVSRIRLIQPGGYRSGIGVVELLMLASGATDIFWPDPGGIQTITRGLPMGPILAEPLAIIELTSDGAGAGASVFDYQIVRRRIKLTRAEAPD